MTQDSPRQGTGVPVCKSKRRNPIEALTMRLRGSAVHPLICAALLFPAHAGAAPEADAPPPAVAVTTDAQAAAEVPTVPAEAPDTPAGALPPAPKEAPPPVSADTPAAVPVADGTEPTTSAPPDSTVTAGPVETATATPSSTTDTAPAETASADAAQHAPVVEPGPTAEQSQYMDAVSSLEAEGGAWDAGLSQHLLGLASAFQETGRHQEAVRALNRAAHITRINEGLYTTSDVPIVERLIESHAALGDWDAVSGNYQQLFQIHQRNYGERDPRMLPVLRKLSAWHVRAWMDAVGDDPLNHLIAARGLSDSSLDILRASYGPADARLVDALRERAIVDYFLASAPQPASQEPSFGFNTGMTASPQLVEGPSTYIVNGFISGRDALEQVVELRRSDASGSPIDTAVALAELADWHLLFGRRQTALNLYREAQATIAQAGERGASATADLFGTPRELPVKPTGFMDVSGTLNYNAYIVVSFQVDERGKPEGMQVIDANPAPGEPQLDRLRKRLYYTRFRPRFEGAEPVATPGLSYRYRYSL